MNGNSPIIVILRPMKKGDPTEYTFKWAESAVKMAKDYGYTVIDIKKEEVTYDNVTNAISYYRPRVVITFSHGCPTSIQGQNECVITRRFTIDELANMQNLKLKQILMPLIYTSGCENTCMQLPDKDICNPICMNDTNVNLLKGSIIYTVSCYSAAQLGICAVRYGTDAYVGYSDLLLFPVDSMHSENMFGDVHLVFLKELFEGKSIGEAEEKMNRYEDALIKIHKKTKYISLPLLWNKTNRKVLGRKDARIFE